MSKEFQFIWAAGLGIAIGILLYALMITILGSYPPSAVVASCSMAPVLDIGDSVILGGNADIAAYDITVSREHLADLTSPIVTVISGKYSAKRIINTSLLDYCLTSPDNACLLFMEDPGAFVEQRGPLSFLYGFCLEGSGWRAIRRPCVKSVKFNNSEYLFNSSHDILVYPSFKNGTEEYIVHRAFFRINSEGRQYFLTHGDNALLFDLQDEQDGIRGLVPSEEVRGKVLFRIPAIGHSKLFSLGYPAQNCSEDFIQRDYG